MRCSSLQRAAGLLPPSARRSKVWIRPARATVRESQRDQLLQALTETSRHLCAQPERHERSDEGDRFEHGREHRTGTRPGRGWCRYRERFIDRGTGAPRPQILPSLRPAMGCWAGYRSSRSCRRGSAALLVSSRLGGSTPGGDIHLGWEPLFRLEELLQPTKEPHVSIFLRLGCGLNKGGSTATSMSPKRNPSPRRGP